MGSDQMYFSEVWADRKTRCGTLVAVDVGMTSFGNFLHYSHFAGLTRKLVVLNIEKLARCRPYMKIQQQSVCCS